MQSASLTRTMPSVARFQLAPVGQTVTQGASCAVQAGLGEVDDAGRAGLGDGLEGVDAVEEGAFGVGAVGVEVGEGGDRRGGGVPLLAGDDAGVAADAGVEVDDEAEASLGGGGERGHGVS